MRAPARLAPLIAGTLLALAAPRAGAQDGAEAPDDDRVREAWSYLLPDEQVDAMARFEAEVVWLDTFQNSLIAHELESLDADAGLLPAAEPPPIFDPAVHAPRQPIARKRVDPESSRVKRVLEQLGGAWPRRLQPAWEYDWAEGRVVRTADFEDPQRLFENGLAGYPPRLDLAEALVCAALDDGAERETHRAFAHAYTDRSGNAYPLTLYEAWCSGASLEMPDVDTLGVVHTLDGDWDTWVAPVSGTTQDDLYERVGEHFQVARRHRGLRVALARTYLVGSADMRDGYASHRDGLHALWNEAASTPADLAPQLPDVDHWAAFLEQLGARMADDEQFAAAGVYRRQTLDWEAWQVRGLLVSILGDAGAFERRRRPPLPRPKPKPRAAGAAEAPGAHR